MASYKPRLELTWIGKENRPRLEPRILIEKPGRSYHAPHQVTENDLYDNKLIFGDISSRSRRWRPIEPQSVTLRELVRRMRNAVAYGRVAISEDLVFAFEDSRTDGSNSISFSFSEQSLRAFVQALAYWIMTRDIELKGLA